MAERFKAHAWKACWVQALAGSNPAPSAIPSLQAVDIPCAFRRAFAHRHHESGKWTATGRHARKRSHLPWRTGHPTFQAWLLSLPPADSGSLAMTVATFDAYAAAKTLREAGFNEGQAEAAVAMVRDAVTEGVATKAGIAALKADLAALKADIDLAHGDPGRGRDCGRQAHPVMGWVMDWRHTETTAAPADRRRALETPIGPPPGAHSARRAGAGRAPSLRVAGGGACRQDRRSRRCPLPPMPRRGQGSPGATPEGVPRPWTVSANAWPRGRRW